MLTHRRITTMQSLTVKLTLAKDDAQQKHASKNVKLYLQKKKKM